MSSPFIALKAGQLPDQMIDQKLQLARLRQVFIEGNQLELRWSTQLAGCESQRFVIAETAFGYGLNLLLCWSLWRQTAPKNADLHYIICDNNPLKRTDVAVLWSLWPEFKREADLFLANYPVLTPGMHQLHFADDKVTVTMILGDVAHNLEQLLVCGEPLTERKLRTYFVDAWFLTSLATIEPIVKSVAMLSKVGTTLTSDITDPSLKACLTALAFQDSRPATTNAMLAVTFTQPNINSDYKQYRNRTTPWQAAPVRVVNTKKAIVVGAGLAGCFSAYALAQRGWQVVLLDAHQHVGQAASAVPQAVLYPQLSAFNSPLTAFMLHAYLYAHRFYAQLLTHQPIGELHGLLQLAHNQKEAAWQKSMREWLDAYPELGYLVDSQQASVLAGIDMPVGGLYLPLSGWLDSSALCHYLMSHPGIDWVANHPVEQLTWQQNQWHCGEHQAAVAIIATGYLANQFTQTATLPLKSMVGQLTAIRDNHITGQLKIPLCSSGHILPARQHQHWLGATYHQLCTDLMLSKADDRMNIAKLESFPPQAQWSNDVVGHWRGIRAATPDYLPLVGSIPVADAFLHDFARLADNSKRWLPHPGTYYPGLFMCAGFGSRGLTTIPLAAEWLASLINNEPGVLSRRLTQALSPARFLLKQIVRDHV